jgi:hypothetical protein
VWIVTHGTVLLHHWCVTNHVGVFGIQHIIVTFKTDLTPIRVQQEFGIRCMGVVTSRTLAVGDGIMLDTAGEGSLVMALQTEWTLANFQ